MKKTVFYLLAAMLLAGTSFTAQAQKQKGLTTAEANAILQKTAGSWEIDFSLWQPQSKQFLKSTGNANFSKQKGCYVREEFKVTKPDGTIEEGEGFLSYSEANKRFEFVQIDNTGKSTMLLTGQYFPENKTLVLNPENGLEQWAQKNGVAMQLQYVFFEDGSFMKSYRTSDANGAYSLFSQYHYKAKSS